MAFIERKNSPGVRSRRSFLGTSFAAGFGGALLRRNVSEGMEIEELPPGVVPSNPRELLYPTPEPNSKIFSKESGSFAARPAGWNGGELPRSGKLRAILNLG